MGRTGRRTTPLWFHTSLACTLPSFSGYGNTNSEGEKRNKNKGVGDEEWAGETFFFYVSVFQLVRASLAKEYSCKLFFFTFDLCSIYMAKTIEIIEFVHSDEIRRSVANLENFIK